MSSLSILQGSGGQHSGQRNSSELGSGLLSRWLSSHYHGGVHDEKSVAHHTVNLLTSTIKIDAEQSDLRFCFRIISPTKSYTLQVNSYHIFILDISCQPLHYSCGGLSARLVRSEFIGFPVIAGRECVGPNGLD